MGFLNIVLCHHPKKMAMNIHGVQLSEAFYLISYRGSRTLTS